MHGKSLQLVLYSIYLSLEMRKQADIDYNNLLKKKQEQEKVYRLVSYSFS